MKPGSGMQNSSKPPSPEDREEGMRVKVRESEHRLGQALVMIAPQVKAILLLGRISRSDDKKGARAEMLSAVLLLGLIGLGTPAMSAGWGDKTPTQTGVTSPGKSVALYTHVPLSFELNQGQTDRRVKFLARGLGYNVFLTSNEAVLALHPTASAGKATNSASPVVRLKLVGANPEVRVSGEEELAGQSNYFLGKDPRRWRTHIPGYAKVRYGGLYGGVDLVYYGRQGELEYDFVVAPGADPGRIRLRVEGAGKTEVNPEGDLVLQAGGGEVRFRRPVAYQGSGGDKHLIAARYVVGERKRIGFEVGEYDRGRPLIIDPVLSYATYLGGKGGDVAYGIAVDSSGNAYVTGSTASTNFPTTSSAVQSTAGGAGDVFVTKFSSTGSALAYSTYLGGSGSDIGTAIAVDSTGNVYVVGSTSSTGFPTTSNTSNALQANYGGNGDAFLAKLDATGSTLVYCTYLGGTNADYAQGVAVDSSGNAYVTGSTESIDFPTANPLQIGNDGHSDAFVSKVNPSGTGLVYSTYLGGSSADTGRAIAVDGSGNVYVSGYTYSSDFPTQNALQSSNAGGSDAFVMELNAAGSALLYSTYIGGAGQDRAFGLALDASGSVYVVGDTQSIDFPTIHNAFQTSNHGQGDAFVFKLGPGGSPVVYSTLLGGSGMDQATGIAVDSSGNAYITGFTQSSDFPTVDPLQTILGIAGAGPCGSTLCADAFVAKLGPSGTPVYSTYLGGNGADFGQAIAVDSSGKAYVAGSTESQNFPVIAGALQGAYAGSGSSSNAFVTKVDQSDAPGMALTPQQINFGNQVLSSKSDPRTVTLTNAGSAVLNITGITASGDFAETNNCGTALPAGGGTCTIQVTFTPATTGTTTDQITLTDNAAGSPHSITVTGNGVISGGALSLLPTSLSFSAGTVGTTSAPQVVRLMNTGIAAVTVTAISISGDYAQTNTCGNLPSVLNVGASCTFSITFTPVGTGTRQGTLSITDDAAGSPQTVSLTGTGNPVFSLSANTRSSVIVIGTASTTFTVSASAPSSFIDEITLSCSSGATCAFDPTSITAGQSSTLTVSNLAATISNPLNFAVTGSSGAQTTSLSLTVFFADFSVSASPALNTVSAGQSATYTVTVTPSNGFNQVVLLGCSNLPQGASCSWSPPGLTLNGTTAATATVTVTTTTQSAYSGRRPPRGDLRPGLKPNRGLWVFLLAILALLATSTASHRWAHRATMTRLQTHVRFVTLVMMVFLIAAEIGCNEYYYSPFRPAPGPGTSSGNYTIVITGTLGNNSAVSRATTVNLTVGAG
jgi:hypothetical protein